MSTLSFQKQAEHWGQAYEILVKRGTLACLSDHGLLTPQHPAVQAWQAIRLGEVSKSLCTQLGITDPAMRDTVSHAVRHLSLTAFGSGYTATRAYLAQVRRACRGRLEQVQLRALWCPLSLPGHSTQDAQQRERVLGAFAEAFGLQVPLDPHWGSKGGPANSDFTLWLQRRGQRDDYLLVQEYSYSMPPELLDCRDQQAHLQELQRHRMVQDTRGVFAQVNAQVSSEHFRLSQDMRHYLGALTSRDKPLYKLCQASAYAHATAGLLHARGLLDKACIARALAITPHGLESLAARFEPGDQKGQARGEQTDPRAALMHELGQAYRDTRKLADGDDAGLQALAETLFRGLLSKLPRPLRQGMKALRAPPAPGEDYLFEFEESVPRFANPEDTFGLSEALAMVDEGAALEAHLGLSARQALEPVMRALAGERGCLSLRSIHASAVIAGMQRARPGQLNVLALEGSPGIGKTTAIRQHLSKQAGGFLLFYTSPRVVINRDVTHSLARDGDGKPSGVLTLTTNARLIKSAAAWHAGLAAAGQTPPRRIRAAVVADGVVGLNTDPASELLVLTPEQEEGIGANVTSQSQRKTTVSEHEDLVRDDASMGVLKCLALAARELLEANPEQQQLVLTAALQGFRQHGNASSTVERLSHLFVAASGTPAGLARRRELARRMPTIVVMVDELTGDGAGAPFAHAVAKWLHEQFIECFEERGEQSPFTVVLVLADASLGNEVVLQRYLESGESMPDKVLVSRSAGERAFRLAAGELTLAGRRYSALHVMANCFPASDLRIHYRVRMTAIRPQINLQGRMETAREAITRTMGTATLEGAVLQILGALAAGSAQAIYFAQSKVFLRELKTALVEHSSNPLPDKQVVILDGSVPEWERKELLRPAVRDQALVFLMTSSGARGVSFPKADWIIASIPRFHIEASLMEIAQLIYRGRGWRRGSCGQMVSGDRVPRTLVMLIDDYLVGEQREGRQWLRQSLDLMTLLVMLRSTILTRITGDSDLSQGLALVPVGRTGAEEAGSSMSHHVSTFLKEAAVFVCKAPSRELQSAAARAADQVSKLFAHMSLQGLYRPQADARSWTDQQDMQTMRQEVCSALSPLFIGGGAAPILPEHVHFCGPMVLEDWTGHEMHEAFEFQTHRSDHAQAVRQLIGQLAQLVREPRLPHVLKTPARDLMVLLQRDKPIADKRFKAIKDVKTQSVRVALPAGYGQFMGCAPEADESFVLQEAQQWHESLQGSLSAREKFMPPIGQYETFPWLATVGGNPSDALDLVFDDRFFMASNELNLLNALLLQAQQEEPYQDVDPAAAEPAVGTR